MLSSRDRVLIHKNAAAADLAAVTIKGEVVRPGRYPLTADMRVSDLIRAAGGLKQSADLKTADLTHFVWKEEKQVTGEQERISLASALAAGDSATNGLLNNAAMTTAPSNSASSSDPTLNNGDVLTIRQVANWQDLGASMTVRGEVVHPGSYGIRPGERLSSVLMRAGGFGPAAYPYGALLMRPEVQRLEERSYSELIQRVRDQQATLKLTATTTGDRGSETFSRIRSDPMADHDRQPDKRSANGSRHHSSFVEYSQLGEHLSRYHGQSGGCVDRSKTPKLCAGAGTGLRSHGCRLSSGQERKVVYHAGGWHYQYGLPEGHLCGSSRWNRDRQSQFAVAHRRHVRRGLAAGRHGSRSRESARWSAYLEDSAPECDGPKFTRYQRDFDCDILLRTRT